MPHAGQRMDNPYYFIFDNPMNAPQFAMRLRDAGIEPAIIDVIVGQCSGNEYPLFAVEGPDALHAVELAAGLTNEIHDAHSFPNASADFFELGDPCIEADDPARFSDRYR